MIELDLCQRILNCLERAGIKDIAQLQNLTTHDLKDVPGLGRDSVILIRQALIEQCGWNNTNRVNRITALRRKIRYHEAKVTAAKTELADILRVGRISI